MKIAIQNISETPQHATFAEGIAELNALLRHGVQDYVAAAAIGVRVSYYRAGMDVFVDGEFWVQLEGTCSRCLAQYPFPLAREFALVLAPVSELGPETKRDSGEFAAQDAALSFYSGEEIDVSPLVLEQLILALPTRPLCSGDCRGLCQQCGASLNVGSCGCAAKAADPRLAVLRGLKVRA